jgi:CubicO group peptidase (beta-lactamase class C family)
VPSLVAGVVRDGGLAWHAGRGLVDGAEPTADTQYRIGSITKVLTAILVMRLRDEGRLGLGDHLARHVGGTPFGERTIGQLLGQGGGVPAETSGPWWERTAGLDWDELASSLDVDAAVDAPGRRFHYSNLGFGVLGRLVEELRGRPWRDCLRDEVLEPLGMRRTTDAPEPPRARGLAVHPWADVVLTEPEHDTGAMAPAGQLWSTLADLARLAAFLLGDTGDVLRPDTVEEMAQPGLVDELDAEPSAYGLGLFVTDVDGRRLVGHPGAMPGFVAGVLVDRDEQVGVVRASNVTYGGDPALAKDLLRILREHEPRVVEEWRTAPLPDGVELDLLGVWYWNAAPFTLRAVGDGLELARLRAGDPPDRFARRGGAWRAVEGDLTGETLTFAADGRSLAVATRVFTRAPYAPAAAMPGGVDPSGWRVEPSSIG